MPITVKKVFYHPGMIWQAPGFGTMATKTQLVELQRLLTAVGQLHAWQGDLLAQADKILAGKIHRPERPSSRPRRSARQGKPQGKGQQADS
jgi:hypothetical protein